MFYIIKDINDKVLNNLSGFQKGKMSIGYIQNLTYHDVLWRITCTPEIASILRYKYCEKREFGYYVIEN